MAESEGEGIAGDRGVVLGGMEMGLEAGVCWHYKSLVPDSSSSWGPRMLPQAT